MTDNQQAYTIDKVFKFLKNKTPDISKNDMFYFNVSEGKMIRTFDVSGKKYIQLLSKDEDITYISFCEEGLNIRFFRSELTTEQIDRLL